MTGPAAPALHADFWHADGTLCGHGWPPGTEPPVTCIAGQVRTALTATRLLCADGLPLAWFTVTARRIAYVPSEDGAGLGGFLVLDEAPEEP